MRLREIFVASLLTITFGCPGDDSGDTDANTTANTTEMPGTTTTGTPDTTTDTPGTTTTGMPDTTTDTPGTTTSGPADSSSGDSGSSSGGGGQDCEQFCMDYFAACGESAANDYGDPGGCVAACEGYDQKTFECKEYHVSMADGPMSVHCEHANIDGGGVC
jgi:hypothetical protein